MYTIYLHMYMLAYIHHMHTLEYIRTYVCAFKVVENEVLNV